MPYRPPESLGGPDETASMARPGYLMLPAIALIGRPNVGKSTLFNRLIGQNRAITHDRPGVTRDRMYGEVRRAERPFRVVDTGGIALDTAGAPGIGPDGIRGFEAEIMSQAQEALQEAEAVVLVLDGRDGLLPLDKQLADLLRQSGKPVIGAVNKVDGEEQEDLLAPEFHALGLDIIPVSASHGHNFNVLLAAMEGLLPEEGDEDSAPEDRSELRLALLGKPNAGKSSLINALAGETRMIVSEMPGTTRDSIDVTITAGDGRKYTFVDTAGIRRRSKITDSLERYTVHAALTSSKKAQVTVLVLDGEEGVSQQDKRLISLLDREKTPFLVAVNKIDLAPKGAMPEIRKNFAHALSICSHVPVLYISALKGKNINAILPAALALWEECGMRVPTGQLNRAMSEALAKHQPPVVKGRRAKFYYMTQSGVRPPTFVMFVNDPARVKPSYLRYLEKRLRKLFGLDTAPMRVLLRESGQDDSRRRGKSKRKGKK